MTDETEPLKGSTLTIHNIEVDLPEDLREKLSSPYKSLEGPNFRTVFLAKMFHSDKSEQEVGKLAAEKFILPDLKKLDQCATIVGALAGMSIMKLVSPALAERLKTDNNFSFLSDDYNEFAAENADKPPFAYAVFIFPVVACNTAEISALQLRNLLRDALVDVQYEGQIGGQEKVEVL